MGRLRTLRDLLTFSSARRWWRRLPLWAKLVLPPAVGVAIAVVLTLRWVVAPAAVESDEVRDVDAVMVFVGGQGTNRLDAAVDAVRASGAEVLVLPNGLDPTWRAATPLCSGERDIGATVLCPSHELHSTAGEASVLGSLGREYGWSRVAVVSSTYHVARVRLEVGRCFDGDVTVVDAGASVRRGEWPDKIVHELAAHAHARVLSRGCG